MRNRLLQMSLLPLLLVAIVPFTVYGQDTGSDVSISDVKCIVGKSVGYAQHPSMADDHAGNVWVCWVSRFTGGTDQVMTKRFSGGKWGGNIVITPGKGKYETPQVACAENGKPMAVWVAIDGNRWQILSSISDGKSFAAPIVAVSGDLGKCRNPSLVADDQGVLFLSWESYQNGMFKLYLKSFDGSEWGRAVEVGTPGLNCYNPSLCVQKDTLWLAYSKAFRAKSGMRDLILTSFDKKTLTRKDSYVTASGTRMSFPSMLVDRHGQLWVSAVDLGVGNIFKGECIAFAFKDGTVLIPKKMEPLTVKKRTKPPTNKKVTISLPYILSAKFADSNVTYPAMVQDRKGRLVVLMRDAIPDVDRVNMSGRRAWGITACVLTEAGWGEPCHLVGIPDAGRKEPLGVAALDDGSLLIVWQQDTIFRRTQKKQDLSRPLPYDRSGEWTSSLYSAVLRVGETCPSVAGIGLKAIDLKHYQPEESEKVPRPRQATFAHNGQQYGVLWGNLHEHSDFSGCDRRCTDGDLDDNYRYSLDATPYDFIAMSDHTQHMNEFMWRASMRASDFYNDPPHFISFVGNENSVPFTTAEQYNESLKKWATEEASKKYAWSEPAKGFGHYNIFFPSSAEAEKFLCKNAVGGCTVYSRETPGTYNIAQMCNKLRELKVDTIVIPHQLACPAGFVDWDSFQADLMPVAEIFQSRGSYEYYMAPATKEQRFAARNFKNRKLRGPNHKGHYVHDAFSKGKKFGFIASGDHSSTGLASTAVFVKNRTADGIFEALRQGRCYATSTPGYEIMAALTVNGHMTGEHVNGDSSEKKIEAKVTSEYPIQAVAVFRNGQNILPGSKIKPGTKTLKLELKDNSKEAENYYYLRVITDGGIAWTSPVWFSRK